MKVKILSRKFFEKIKGTPEESRRLETPKIISIQSTYGFDSEPPFTLQAMKSSHLLCLKFDDIANEPQILEEDIGPGYSSTDSKQKRLSVL